MVYKNNPFLAHLDCACWLNAQKNLITPGIINANQVFLLFKGNLIGNQSLFDFLQSLTSRNGNHIRLQTGCVFGCGFCSARVPGVQANVMMVTTSADKNRSML